MRNNFIMVNQICNTLGITEARLSELLTECGCTDFGPFLTAEQVGRLMDCLAEHERKAQRYSEDKLRRLVENSEYMFIDTCSLLHPAFPQFLENVKPLLLENGRQMILLSSIVQELIHVAEKKPECAETVRNILPLLQNARQKGLIQVYGANLSFGDGHLLPTVQRLRLEHKVMVITQDGDLAADLFSQNHLLSVRGRSVRIYKLNRYGYLSAPDAVFSSSSGSGRFSASSGVSDSRSKPQAAPVLCPEDGISIAPVHIPISGDTVCGDSGSFELGSLLEQGGEGCIYEMQDGTVAKIYKADRLTANRLAKLKRMVQEPVDYEGICWPKELLYDTDGRFVGFRMVRAEGTALSRSAMMPMVLERRYPDWKRKDLVQLAVTILQRIAFLHRHGILLGDINTDNIMMSSPSQVWFVDCDSYQIDGFPCPVGKSAFTAPEIQNRNYGTFLRSMGNENFAVAVLLFMLMLPGKHPYSRQGSEDLSETIRDMRFPYPCGDTHSENLPAGKWAFAWSHLPRFLKEMFSETFRQGGKNSTEADRLSTANWLSSFRHYLDLLESGKLESQDIQSGMIFPTRLKQTGNAGSVAETRVCVECGEEFDIMESEMSYYDKHALELPRRCPTCRRLRKTVA